MNTADPPGDEWREFADQVGACASSFVRLMAPDCESVRTLRTHFLRAQAELLRGLLAVVEGKLAQTEERGKPPAEKIKVE